MSDINTESTLQLSDSKVFEGFFKTHYAALCRSSFRIVNDRDAAEDIVQEVFFRLIRDIGMVAVQPIVELMP